MKNSINKQLVGFKLHTILNNIMKSFTSLLCSALRCELSLYQMYPHYICHPPVYKLVILVVKSTGGITVFEHKVQYYLQFQSSIGSLRKMSSMDMGELL
jgi:hypothetical protein